VVNIPSQPEIITVNSEQLQTVIRDLLPSQNGFGSELQASNVITPIIDLTPAAEGSGIRSDLQTAISFGSNTPFAVGAGTQVLTNNPGWYRVVGTATVGAAGVNAEFSMTDGFSTKTVWSLNTAAASQISQEFDLVIAIGVGITLSAIAAVSTNMVGSFRQIADAQGQLVNPVGLPL
jgi:predicted Zn-dependent protease